MIKLIFTMALMTLVSSHTICANEQAEVMLFGTFHFTNPGLDKVKTAQHDVSTDDSQRYLKALSSRIAKEFHPSHVLVECQPKDQAAMDEKFGRYKQGDFALPINENYQLGFRIAKLSGAKGVICYDNRDIQWNAGPLFEYMPKHAPEAQARFDALIERVTEQMNQMHEELTLAELFAKFNDPTTDDLNKSIYIMTNDVGSESEYQGAVAAASWWHRNFRMFANVQKVAKPNTRTLVIGGQGHIAILKDFLALDPIRKAHKVNTYL